MPNALEEAHIGRLAATLSSFYRLTQRPRVSPGEYYRPLEAEQADNRKVLTLPRFVLHDFGSTVVDRMEAALAASRSKLESRAAGGHLADGHGDLRPEHVCFLDGVIIFDRLEFNDNLRQVDPVDEIAGLIRNGVRPAWG